MTPRHTGRPLPRARRPVPVPRPEGHRRVGDGPPHPAPPRPGPEDPPLVKRDPPRPKPHPPVLLSLPFQMKPPNVTLIQSPSRRGGPHTLDLRTLVIRRTPTFAESWGWTGLRRPSQTRRQRAYQVAQEGGDTPRGRVGRGSPSSPLTPPYLVSGQDVLGNRGSVTGRSFQTPHHAHPPYRPPVVGLQTQKHFPSTVPLTPLCTQTGVHTCVDEARNLLSR